MLSIVVFFVLFFVKIAQINRHDMTYVGQKASFTVVMDNMDKKAARILRVKSKMEKIQLYKHVSSFHTRCTLDVLVLNCIGTISV